MRNVRKASNQQDSGSLLQVGFVLLRSSVIAVIFTLICFVIFAVVMKLADLQETIIPPVIQVIRTISIALGGALAARSSHSRGWLKGSLTGLLYVFWAFLISSLFGKDLVFDNLMVSDVLLGLVAGAVGGIIGINLE